MPTPYLMTWIASQRSWTIQYMGQRYYVSCRQLGIKPATKEASIQAANEWWREKQASIDLAYRANQQAAQRTPQPKEDLPSILLGGESGDLLATLRGIMGEHFADPPPVDEETVAWVLRLLATPIHGCLLRANSCRTFCGRNYRRPTSASLKTLERASAASRPRSRIGRLNPL